MDMCRPVFDLDRCPITATQIRLCLMYIALPWVVRAGAAWRLLPDDFPPWEAVYQQTQRWLHVALRSIQNYNRMLSA